MSSVPVRRMTPPTAGAGCSDALRRAALATPGPRPAGKCRPGRTAWRRTAPGRSSGQDEVAGERRIAALATRRGAQPTVESGCHHVPAPTDKTVSAGRTRRWHQGWQSRCVLGAAGCARSACRCADPRPVTVRVAQFDLASIRQLACGSAKLGHDGVDITRYQVDQGAWPGITLVLGQVQPRPAPCNRDERGHAGLEAVLPLLRESQPPIPADRLGGVGDAKDRDDFLVQAGMVAQTPGGLVGLAERANLGAARATLASPVKPTGRGRPSRSRSVSSESRPPGGERRPRTSARGPVAPGVPGWPRSQAQPPMYSSPSRSVTAARPSGSTRVSMRYPKSRPGTLANIPCGPRTIRPVPTS
jgi:hypothetical protein